jgi:hypothetical protein
MPAQIGRFSRVALIRVRADRGSWAVCDGPLSGIIPQKRTSVGSHRNPVPSWHYTHGRAGWREGPSSGWKVLAGLVCFSMIEFLLCG